ncbi:MAG TPA: energy transducer TonB, partial [Xanthomonadaceae bacterium]|nr:energy transducer TonB [Xanthomonadaceae bacterium]
MSPHAASYSPTRLRPDPLRISGTAAAIAINAAVLMLLLTPLRAPPLAAPEIVVIPDIFFPAKPKPVPPPPV